MTTNNPEVTHAWTNWLKQHLHDDTNGRYAAFTLTTEYSQWVLREKFSDRCSAGTFVFLLPATSARGHQHFHGLIRVPANAIQCQTEVTIREAGRDKSIEVPELLRTLLWNRYTQTTKSTFGDLHLRNDGKQVVLMTYRTDAAASVLSYWKKTSDHEVRDFSNGEFIPHHHRTAIKVRKGRDPLPGTERLQ